MLWLSPAWDQSIIRCFAFWRLRRIFVSMLAFLSMVLSLLMILFRRIQGQLLIYHCLLEAAWLSYLQFLSQELVFLFRWSSLQAQVVSALDRKAFALVCFTEVQMLPLIEHPSHETQAIFGPFVQPVCLVWEVFLHFNPFLEPKLAEYLIQDLHHLVLLLRLLDQSGYSLTPQIHPFIHRKLSAEAVWRYCLHRYQSHLLGLCRPSNFEYRVYHHLNQKHRQLRHHQHL